jgi:Tfp pilus assembly protein PilF
VTKLGLITKAIKKVEKKDNPLAQQEMSPQPKRKKRIAIAVAALLFMGTSLGLGYLFLLKPALEVPPHVARRSMSAKKKPPKLAIAGSKQKRDTGEIKATSGEKETVSKKTSKKPGAPQKPAKEAGMVGKQTEKTSKPDNKEPSALLSESRTPTSEKEQETPKSEIKEASELPISPTTQEEKKIPIDVTPSEGKREAPGEYVRDEIASSGQEEIPSEEIAPSYAMDLREGLAQKPLTVTERSDSRAQKYYNKGISYQQQGKLDRAIASYRKALTFNPDHVQAHINLATAYLQTGRFKEAEQELIYVYALKPRDPKILFNFGLLLYQTKEYSSAETKLKRLLESDPLHLEATLLMANVYEEKGELDKAVEYCMRAYRINSTDPRVIYWLGRAWDVAGETTKAVKYYRLFLSTGSEKESGLNSPVRDRLNYLVSRKEKK